MFVFQERNGGIARPTEIQGFNPHFIVQGFERSEQRTAEVATRSHLETVSVRNPVRRFRIGKRSSGKDKRSNGGTEYRLGTDGEGGNVSMQKGREMGGRKHRDYK